jgi:hypothetical protein
LELVENTLLLGLLAVFPAPASLVVSLASWATRLKLAGSLPLTLSLVVGLLALGVNRWRRR